MSEAQANFEVPDTLNYTNEDVKRMNSYPKLRLGWYEFYVKAVTKGVSEGKKNPGSFMVTLTCQPINAAGDPEGPTIRNNLFLPIVNDKVEGHKAPNTGGLCHQYLTAVNSEKFERYPRWDKNLNGFVRADGEVVDKETAEKLKVTISDSVLKEMIQVRWSDPDQFLGDKFYAKVIQNGQYRNVDSISAEAPPEADVIRSDFADTEA